MESERTEVFAPTDYRREARRRGRRPYGQVTSCAVRRDDVGIVPYGGDKGEKEPSDFGF